MQEFLAWLGTSGRSRRTVSAYTIYLQSFKTWYEQTDGIELNPAGLTPADVRDYRAYLTTVRGAAAATVNAHLAAIKLYGVWSVEAGRAGVNPARGVRGMSSQRLAPRWLDRRQQNALLRSIQVRRAGARTETQRRSACTDCCIVTMLMHTGLRVGELCALDIADLKLGERSGSVMVTGKGERQRAVPLNRTVRDALRDYLDNVRGYQQGHGRLFEISVRMVQQRLKFIATQSGIKVTPHVLRHTAAKSLLDSGVSLEQVASVLGHSSLDTTRIYTVPSQGDLQAAVDRLDN